MVFIASFRFRCFDCRQIEWTVAAYYFTSHLLKSREKLVELLCDINQVCSLFSSHHETMGAIRKFRSKKFAPELQVKIAAIVWQIHHVYFYFCLVEICNLLCDLLHGYDMLISFIDLINWLLLLVLIYFLKHGVLMDHIGYLPLFHFEALQGIKAVIRLCSIFVI